MMPKTGNPFPGLRPFAREEADLFFGRDKHCDAVVRRLEERRFVAVVGSSGSGKSSLIRAGVMASLEGGFMASAGARWRMMIFRPQDDPVGNLARSFIKVGALCHLEISETARATIIETTLRRSARGVADVVLLAPLDPGESLLIVVDQFEELFRFAGLANRHDAADDAAGFVKLLLEAVRDARAPIYVILTMRSEWLGDCARFRDLPKAVSESQFLVPQLTRDELESAIRGPINVCGGDITRALVQRLLNEVGDDMDGLPVLQHALMRVWSHWKANAPEDRGIGTTDLDDVGGLQGALSRHADEAYQDLDEADQAPAARVFKALTERGPHNLEVRRPRTIAHLAKIADISPTDVGRIVKPFRASERAFLMPPAGEEVSDDSVIDISHESLIRRWERLREWVEEEAQARMAYHRLVDAGRAWREGTGDLWSELAVTRVRQLERRERLNDTWAEQYGGGFEQAMAFLTASEDKVAADQEAARLHAEKERDAAKSELEQARALAKARARITILAVTFAIVASIGAYAAYSAKADAEREHSSATEAKALAERHLQVANDIINRIPDPGLRAQLAKEYELSGVKILTDAQKTQLEHELQARPGSPLVRKPPQDGLKLWTNGIALHVAYVGGTPTLRKSAQRAAEQWATYANIHFQFGVAENAEIRIAFKPGEGSWSYIGTDALGVAIGDPTMNLGIPQDAAMLHEFGHVLGLIHESASPNAVLPWNKQAVYDDFSGAPNFWDKATIDANLFLRATNITSYRPFDVQSIMMYSYPAKYFTDGRARVGGRILSESDKKFVAQLYPR